MMEGHASSTLNAGALASTTPASGWPFAATATAVAPNTVINRFNMVRFRCLCAVLRRFSFRSLVPLVSFRSLSFRRWNDAFGFFFGTVRGTPNQSE